MARKNVMKMVMKQHDIETRWRLLEKWGHRCIVCGHEFMNLACVSKEHVIPRSKVHQAFNIPKSPTKRWPESVHRALADNKAPSHYQCNKLRRDRSLIEAYREVEQMKQKMKPRAFLEWLNRLIPNRVVPPWALTSMRPQGCLELPDSLPGMDIP